MKKFFKKPLNVVSFALAVLGLIGIIVMLVVPHGRTYTSKTTENDKTSISYVTLKGGKLYSSLKVDGEYVYEDKEFGEYSIDKGKLSYKAGLVSIEVGEINSFKLSVVDDDATMTCNMTVVFFVIACVMAVFGLAGTIYGFVAPKKKSSKKK